MGVKILASNRIAVVGDDFGIPQLLKYLPREIIACFIVADIRPKALPLLSNIAQHYQKPLLIQPKIDSSDYPNFIKQFCDTGSTRLICHSYSMLIQPEILQAVNYQAANIHFSLLPQNRGPNPVQWAIIKGEQRTGVTMHYMTEDIDEGDIIAQLALDITMNDTWLTLRQELISLTEGLLQDHLPAFLSGSNSKQAQDHSHATINPRLLPSSPVIDFATMTDRNIYNLIRAQVAPLKGAYLKQGDSDIRFTELTSFDDIKKLRSLYAKDLHC